MAHWHLPPEVVLWTSRWAGLLDARSGQRLLPLLTGALFARGRRTVASWLRAAGLGQDFRAYYYFVSVLGRKARWIAGLLVHQAISVLEPGERLLFALDDTPTKRYGRQVEGAGIHHNPTPGPADQKFLYGHIWVTVAWVVRHPLWGAIGLPLLAMLYVREKDIAPLTRWYGVTFRTKLELAADLVGWIAGWLQSSGKTLWVVADGAYAARPFLRAAAQAKVTVVSRLRKNAALWSVPPPPRPGSRKQRGRPPIYGTQRLDLAKRAGQRGGWQTGTFRLYGRTLTKVYKTFLATYQPAGGVIQAVIIKETDGWVAYFSTNPQATVEQILEAVADRAAIEQTFHDLKEVHGTGQQQVRNYWANLGAYQVTLWGHTLIELWAWDKPQRQLCHRQDRPWDRADRRPSHADRRKALCRSCLDYEFRRTQAGGLSAWKISALYRRVLRLAA
jgi:DDE superfamily endonuclease